MRHLAVRGIADCWSKLELGFRVATPRDAI
jgi:hypothetical protein